MQKQANPILSIIIVNYNVKDEILNCIQSIRDKIDSNRCPYEVIVSDNGSVDGSVEAIRERFSWVKVIENKANPGFGKANNIGAKQAKGNILFFLNPDTEIKQGIEEMADFLFNHPKTGISGPIIFDRWNKDVTYFEVAVYLNLFLQLIDFVFTPLARLYSSYKRFVFKRQVKKGVPFKTDLVHGCAMMLNKCAFDNIGGFDDDLFLYGEEADIGQKLKKLHYETTIFPQAEIIHHEGSSTKQAANMKKSILCTIAMRRVLQKHFSYTWGIRYRIEMLSQLRQLLIAYMNAYFYVLKKDTFIKYHSMADSHLKQYRLLKRVLHEQVKSLL